MNIIGYRAGADFNKATVAFSKHLEISLHEAKRISDMVERGEIVNLESDFVLQEDLKECDFFVV